MSKIKLKMEWKRGQDATVCAVPALWLQWMDGSYERCCFRISRVV